jgi:amino acid permease
MRHPEQFPKVLTLGMIICICLFILIGTLGYAAYGENTHASVVSNLPHQNGLAITVQLFYAIAIILSSPFVLFPPLSIVEHGIFGTTHSGRLSLKHKWYKNLVRACVPLACAGLSYAVGSDGLNQFVALIGSLCCMPLCFIFPGTHTWYFVLASGKLNHTIIFLSLGLFHYKVTNSTWAKVGDVIMILWGFGVMIFTLYVNILSWIHPLSATNESPIGSCPL